MRLALTALALVALVTGTAVPPVAFAQAPPGAPPAAPAAPAPGSNAAPGAPALSDAMIKMMIVGSWAESAACKDGALVFNADGTFVSKAPDGSPPGSDLMGMYSIMGGQLLGMAGDIQMPTVAISFDAMGKMTMGDGPDADVLQPCK